MKLLELKTVALIFVTLLLPLWNCGCGGSNLGSCNESEFFTVAPVSTDDLSHIVPLGNLNPSGHTFPTDHVYVVISGESATVYAPGDVTITSITEQTNLTEGTTDYQIHFTPCSAVSAYYLHIDTLDESLASEIGSFDNCNSYTTGGNSYRNCSTSPDLAVTAGSVIGAVDGTFDFGLYDERMSALAFANPARWSGDSASDYPYTVCPLNYYTSALHETLESYLGGDTGNETGRRTVEPLCGQIDQDSAGTAQGIWFVEGTTDTTPEDPHLALVHDNLDPAIAVISNGTSLSGLASGAYEFTPGDLGLVNRDFADITVDGEIYCFEGFLDETIVLLELTSDTTLRVEAQAASACGDGPWNFGSSFTNYER